MTAEEKLFIDALEAGLEKPCPVVDQGSSSQEFCKPLAKDYREQVKSEAKVVKELLGKWSVKSAMLASWFKGFYAEVAKLSLTPAVGSFVTAHGYKGALGTSSVPRVDELKKALQELGSSGLPAYATNKSFRDEAESWSYDEEVSLLVSSRDVPQHPHQWLS